MKLFKINWRGELGFSYRPALSFVLASTSEEAERMLKEREGDHAACIIDNTEEIPLDQPGIINDEFEW